jgi:hypothetical protein
MFFQYPLHFYWNDLLCFWFWLWWLRLLNRWERDEGQLFLRYGIYLDWREKGMCWLRWPKGIEWIPEREQRGRSSSRRI